MPSDTRRVQDICRQCARLTPRDRARLDAFPGPVRPSQPCVGCVLVTNHTGLHVAAAMLSTRTPSVLWLRWGRWPWQRQIYAAVMCDALSERYGVPDFCRLPAGHPGLHSFDYLPDLWNPNGVEFGLDDAVWHLGPGRPGQPNGERP